MLVLGLIGVRAQGVEFTTRGLGLGLLPNAELAGKPDQSSSRMTRLGCTIQIPHYLTGS